ncbi:hypothetical protein TRIUR3_06752 [Triticum urartu]|uniref:Uncharacterized protein n=1 Tax=Triticum urartu TaxID=4572 RepID=M7YKK0_TRIUA|nr:hypothetical protein TRIUR3_06752 [Triticum urartu]
MTTDPWDGKNDGLDELLIQAIQSKAQSPTIGCQLATALWKTASELSPSGLVRVKRRTRWRSCRLLDFSPETCIIHQSPTRDAGVHADLTAKASRNGEIVQSRQEYEEARRSQARHIPKKIMGNSSLVRC